MENMKTKLLLIVGIISIIAICSFSYYFLVYKTTDYDVQIDNRKVEAISVINNIN